MGKVKRYYKCLGRKHHNGCTKLVLRKEDLEDLIIKKILEILQTPKYMNTIVDNLMNIQNSQSNSIVLTALLKEQKQAQTTLDNIMKALEKGITNNTTNRRMKKLEDQLLELEKLILIERSKTTYKFSKEEIINYYLAGLQLEPKLLIDYLVKEITLYDDKIEIAFNTPLKTSPTNLGFSFDSK